MVSEDWQLSFICLTLYFTVLVESRVVGEMPCEMVIFANHHKLRRPLLNNTSLVASQTSPACSRVVLEARSPTSLAPLSSLVYSSLLYSSLL